MGLLSSHLFKEAAGKRKAEVGTAVKAVNLEW